MDFKLKEKNGIKYWLKDNNANTTLVFVHGYQSFSDHLEPLCEFENNFNIISTNYPGNSHYKENIEMNAAEIGETLDKFVTGIKTDVILLGHSFGGAIISSMKMTRKIKGFIFMSSFTTSIMHSKAHCSIMEISNMDLPAKKIESLLKTASKKNKYDYEWASWFVKPGKGFIKLYKTNIIDKGYIENELDSNIRNITKPIFSLIGKDDIVVPVTPYVKYFEELGIKTTIIPSASHSPVKTNIKAVSEYLNNIIEFKERKKKKNSY